MQLALFAAAIVLAVVSPRDPNARTVRLRFATRAGALAEHESLMLAAKLPKSDDWKATEADGKFTYTSSAGRVEIVKDPWQIRCYDAPGIQLTEHFAMHSAASVCGLYFAHPAARYFAVDRLTRDQVEDYAKRKRMSLSEVERWLAPNLGYDPVEDSTQQPNRRCAPCTKQISRASGRMPKSTS